MIKKTTSNNITCTFFCIQPIQLNDNVFISLLNKEIIEKKIETFLSNNDPKWITKFNKKQLYNNFYTIKTDFSDLDNNILKDELSKNYLVNGHTLDKKIDIDNCTFYLLYDSRLKYFNLIYEMPFIFDLNNINQFIESESEDFYNIVRNLIVKEEDSSTISLWAQKIRKNILSKIQYFLKEVYAVTLKPDDIFIDNHTGNITNVVTFPSNIDKETFENINTKFINLNQKAENKVIYDDPILLNNYSNTHINNLFSHELYYFSSRFHTITTLDVDLKYRYIPIQFHMQYMWFYLKKINTIMDIQYNDIRKKSVNKNNILKNSNIIDELIFIVETLNIHNERFKLVIDRDNILFSSIQHKWNIESLLYNSTSYINFFKDHLNRLYAKKSSIVEQRQNKILLFITLFQFIALLSVWNDYLSLLDDDLEKKADEIIPLFGSYNTLEIFNTFLPVGFIVIILLMIIYIFKSK